MNKLTRRSLLKKTLIAGASLPVLASALSPTPPQTEGPFYPEGGIKRDNDLTLFSNKALNPIYPRLYLFGQVLNVDDQPLPHSVVEIWQADHQGIYNDPGDPQQPQADKNFQFWGRSLTDSSGHYFFRTIKPKKYSLGGGQFRTPHIHFKVFHPGYRPLTTQLYFSEEKMLNQRDLVFSRIPLALRERVIVDALPEKMIESTMRQRLLNEFRMGALEPTSKVGEFHLGLVEA